MARSEEESEAGSVFHEGERRAQEAAGVRDRMEQVGRAVIRGFMPDQHRQFFATLPILFVGSLDAARRPWASVLHGRPGFAHSPDPRTLRIDAGPGAGDPLADNLAVGAPLGILGLEASTRRRNRMNGTVTTADGSGFTIAVDQSFGNCPQYIQARRWSEAPSTCCAAGAERLGAALDDEAVRTIRGADTFFLASASPAARAHGGADGVDVSHRGGLPGFVRVDRAAAAVLAIPDFRGNFLFNTVGNLVAWPHAGLLFVDYAGGDLLHLAGRAEVVTEAPDLAAFAGAQRLVVVTVEEGLRRRGALPLAWSEPEFAAQLEGTGRWESRCVERDVRVFVTPPAWIASP